MNATHTSQNFRFRLASSLAAGMAAVLAAPIWATAAPVRSAPFDGTVVEAMPYYRADIPVCAADATSGAIAGEVVVDADDAVAVDGEIPQGYCKAGFTTERVQVPAHRNWGDGKVVSASATFHVEHAVVDVPAGSRQGEASVFPCVEFRGPARAISCNWPWNDSNGVFTPLFGPLLPVGAHDEAHDETWTWSIDTGLPEGRYEVRAYLVFRADNSDSLVGGVTAEGRATVTSITVDTSA